MKAINTYYDLPYNKEYYVRIKGSDISYPITSVAKKDEAKYKENIINVNYRKKMIE